MNLNDFCQKAISQFEENPTDALFCYIQCNKELMKDYLDLVNDKDNHLPLKNINSGIAQALARHYNTQADKEKSRNKMPSSTLIQGYSILS